MGITFERRFVCSVKIPATFLPATAVWSIHVQGDMSELTGRVGATAIQTAVDDDAARETSAHTHVKQIANVCVLRFTVPDFSERRTARRVVDDNGKTRGFLQQIHDRHVAPRQDHGQQKLSALVIDETRQADADAGKLDERIVLRAKLANLLADLRQERRGYRSGLETHTRNDAIVEVAQREHCLIRSDVAAEESKAFGVESQGRRRLTTDRRGASGTFLDDAGVFE